MVLCRCPNWCESQYQIAYWNGKEFYYDDQPNDWFHENVIAFLPLDGGGLPIKI